jgi:hypothetical protein
MKSHQLLVGAALLGLAASPALAHQEGRDAEAAKPAAATPAATDAQSQSRVVVRDPVTGRLRAPTDAELAALQPRGAAARTAPVVVRQHANGMKSAVLGPEYMSTLIVERGPDGKLVKRHADPRDEHAVPSGKASTQAATE